MEQVLGHETEDEMDASNRMMYDACLSIVRRWQRALMDFGLFLKLPCAYLSVFSLVLNNDHFLKKFYAFQKVLSLSLPG